MTPREALTLYATLLDAADRLRRTQGGPNTGEGGNFAFRRSTLGLASLIESWCVDNANTFVPTLMSGMSDEARADERAFLDELSVRLRPVAGDAVN
ncbi:MAG: hypothetical protein R3F55_14965 [Alphaproteobacteria bacterium]